MADAGAEMKDASDPTIAMSLATPVDASAKEELDTDIAIAAAAVEGDDDLAARDALAASRQLKSVGVEAEPEEKAARRTTGPPGSASGYIATKVETAKEELPWPSLPLRVHCRQLRPRRAG